MSTSIQNLTAAGSLGSPITNVFPAPIISQRAPTANDKAPLGSLWINSATQDYYVLTSVVANVATWAVAGNGNGIFNTVEVTGGDLTVDVGDVVIQQGNLLVDAGNVVVTAGTITSAGSVGAGNFVLTEPGSGYYLEGGIRITSGAGAPANILAVAAGDMYIRLDPADAASRIYIATGVGAWTNVDCAA